jgi:DivIVA domain-containing protein
MPLTPADIHNVAFRKPSIGKRGYDEEEVDAFLDEAERELARLIEENNELRAQVERGPSAELDAVKVQLDRAQRDKAAAEQAVEAMRVELEQAHSIVGPGGEQAPPMGVMMMAQRTADNHIADARREADKLLSDARAEADEVAREARAAADALERDARQRHQHAVAAADARRTEALERIEELREFHREYRNRLKAHLESRLRDLGGGGGG